jgi:hypothetical protein
MLIFQEFFVIENSGELDCNVFISVTYFTSHHKLFSHKCYNIFLLHSIGRNSSCFHAYFRLMTNVMHSLMLRLTMLYSSLTKAPFHNEIPTWLKAWCILILNQQWAIMHATVNHKMHHGNEKWIIFIIVLHWFCIKGMNKFVLKIFCKKFVKTQLIS